MAISMAPAGKSSCARMPPGHCSSMRLGGLGIGSTSTFESCDMVPRMIRLALADDLLLVLHGYGQDPSDRDLVTISFDTLRRTR